jgi:putative DNA-invertase from lambdoid prophage Rac
MPHATGNIPGHTTLEHQRSRAETAGFKIDEVIADHGVSAVATKLADRPGGRRLLDKVRAGDQIICRWVDRLGRNYDEATATIRHLMNVGRGREDGHHSDDV